MTTVSDMVIGIDLAGPANAAETAVACFEGAGAGLVLHSFVPAASDGDIVRVVAALAPRPTVVGLDAPLSYNDGGGDRPGDRALRGRIIAAGLRSGSVMAPTFTRMAFLTLRGIGVARALQLAGASDLRLVEVHPGAAFALHGAPITDVRNFRRTRAARKRLLRWLGAQGVHGLTPALAASSHLVAACGAAFAACKWSDGKSAWSCRASPPLHPFDFAC